MDRTDRRTMEGKYHKGSGYKAKKKKKKKDYASSLLPDQLASISFIYKQKPSILANF